MSARTDDGALEMVRDVWERLPLHGKAAVLDFMIRLHIDQEKVPSQRPAPTQTGNVIQFPGLPVPKRPKKS